MSTSDYLGSVYDERARSMRRNHDLKVGQMDAHSSHLESYIEKQSNISSAGTKRRTEASINKKISQDARNLSFKENVDLLNERTHQFQKVKQSLISRKDMESYHCYMEKNERSDILQHNLNHMKRNITDNKVRRTNDRLLKNKSLVNMRK